MFYERFKKICDLKGVKPSNVLKEINVGIGNTTKWKNGALPNGSILIKMADYFDCSVDHLLGRTEIPDTNYSRLFKNDTNLKEITMPNEYTSLFISERIKELSNKKHITVKKLLEDLELGRNFIVNMKGRMPVSDNLAKIADYLDCSVDYLLGRTELPDVNHTHTENLSNPELNYHTKNKKTTVDETIVDFLKKLS